MTRRCWSGPGALHPTSLTVCLVEAGAGPERVRPRRKPVAQLMPAAAQAFCSAALEQTFSLVVKPSAMTSFTLSL